MTRRARWRERGARRRVAAIGALLAAGLALSACGIPTQPSASPIPTRGIRTRLPSAHPAANPCSKSCVTVDVYFVTPSDYLAPVGRVIPIHSRLRTVIGALLGGPTTADAAKGFRTALSPGTNLLSANVTGHDVTLNFGLSFGDLSGTEEVLGVAQVVCTVNAVRPGDAVSFEIAGVPSLVPVATGADSAGPVRESQYAALLTPALKTTTTTTAAP